MQTLHERLSRNPEPWKPTPGDLLVGTVLDITERTTEYGDYPIVTISNNDGSWEFHAFHTVARQEIRRQRPNIGDLIGVRYLGKPDGKDYELYRIVIERLPTSPNPLPAIAEEPF